MNDDRGPQRPRRTPGPSGPAATAPTGPTAPAAGRGPNRRPSRRPSRGPSRRQGPSTVSGPGRTRIPGPATDAPTAGTTGTTGTAAEPFAELAGAQIDEPTGIGPNASGATASGAAPFWRSDRVTLYTGDALATLRALPAASVDTVVTSPPYYGLRHYGVDGQYGLEATPQDYVDTLRAVFAALYRVLRPTGTVWLNLGDSYAATPPSPTRGDPMRTSTLRYSASAAAMRAQVSAAGVDRTRTMPRKNMLGMPWRVALALQADGWILRNAIVWAKRNPMPQPYTDRLSGTYEFVFLLVRQPRYFFDLDAVRVPHAHPPAPATTPRGGVSSGSGRLSPGSRGARPRPGRTGQADERRGRNPGDVWSLATRPLRAAHVAPFPIDLPLRCIAAGSPQAGTVLDPFSGSGTTGLAAVQLGRRYVGIDLNPAYNALARGRLLSAAQTEGPGTAPAQGPRRAAGCTSSETATDDNSRDNDGSRDSSRADSRASGGEGAGSS